MCPARIVVAPNMRFGAGVQAAQEMRQRGARDDVTRNVIVWLPGLPSEAGMANRVVPWLASGPQQPRHVVDKDPSFTQTTLSSTSAPIELDTVRFRFFVQIAIAMVIGPIRRLFWAKRNTSLRPIAIFVQSLIYRHLSTWLLPANV